VIEPKLGAPPNGTTCPADVDSHPPPVEQGAAVTNAGDA
jgi:hypothetical protein